MRAWRVLAAFAVGAALCWAADQLDVTSGLGEMVDQHLTPIAESQLRARKAQIAGLRTPEEVKKRQEYIRTQMANALGGFPTVKTPLNARVTGTLKRDGYRVEKLIYESLPGYYVTANVYVPETGSGPFAAVLGTAGHDDGAKAYAPYQTAFIALAKRGFLVLAYDPPCQGERLEYLDATGKKSAIGAGVNEHIMSGLQCLLTGTNIARYELWDGIRAVDYLLTRKDVDPKRIAVAGNSGGGTQSAYMAVVEPRLAAAAPSCYITAWEKLWAKPGPQDSEQVLAGFLKDGLNFPDYLIAFAPKPIKMLTAIQDFFPIDGARTTYAEARQVFKLLGKEDQVGYFEYDDGHGWSKPRREATYAWFEKWLYQRDTSAPEPDITPEPASNLNCTETGQIATSLKSKTIQILNQEMAEELYAHRTAARKKGLSEIKRLITDRLQVTAIRNRPTAKPHGEIARDGYRIEKLTIESEPGITIPILLMTPSQEAKKLPAVIAVNAEGKATDAGTGGKLESLVRAGYIVIAPDLRGMGESRNPSAKSGHGKQFQTDMRAILVGKTAAGMQTTDLLSVFRFASSLPNVDAKRISVIGSGNAGIVALYAAAFEPRFRKVVLEDSILSYMDIVRAKQHKGIVDIVVPGVLRDFDLPDIAKALGKEKIVIVHPQNPNGGAASKEDAARQYGPAVQILDTLTSYADLLSS